jgi:outer membrane protein TolC
MNRINGRYYADQHRPQVNAYASYTTSGLAGALANRPPNALFGDIPLAVPPQLVGGLTDALMSSFNQRYPTFRVGVKVSIPLRNTVAAANLGLNAVDARRIQNQKDQLEQAVATEVRNAAQALQSSKARLRTAQHAREFAQIEFESEKRRLQVGITSVFELFSKQTNMVAAQGREVQARTDLRKAVIELERAMGRTFDVYNIDIQKQSAPIALPIK